MQHPDAGCCGDYCGKCPNYLDRCPGCIQSAHRGCYFAACCARQGIEHCGLCTQFPCEKLSAFVPDDRAECPAGFHLESVLLRTRIGTDAWMAIQRERWQPVPR